jgi:hypothetical protein
MTTRRAFIKATAALPAIAAVGVEVPAVAAPVVEAVPAAALTPYTDYPWRWWVGHSEEVFNEWFETKEEALEFAKRDEASFVAECCQQDFSLDIDGYEVLELLEHNNEERIGEGDFFSCTDEQERDLGEMVTQAVEAWAIKHKIDLQAWTFGATRNSIKLDSPPLSSSEGQHDR